MKKLLFDKNSILDQIKDRYSMAIIIKLIKNSARAETRIFGFLSGRVKRMKFFSFRMDHESGFEIYF